MKKIFKYIWVFVCVISFFSLGVRSYAHSTSLNVIYDSCLPNKNEDADEEKWYLLTWGALCRHIGNEQNTIKYYFEERRENGTYTWTTDVSLDEANKIKTALANSMEKWNNIYFYANDDYGNITKHKVINVEEGTKEDHNLSIYPMSGTDKFASTTVESGYVGVEMGDILHQHYSFWEMSVFVNSFQPDSWVTEADIDVALDRVGAHEIGHLLGLFDVDELCEGTGMNGYHHHELLMGYGYPIENRSLDITYKDIAGVAITRGFHTDNDHKWLNAGMQDDGTYKLICSICNGVKYDANLSQYAHNAYEACNNIHDLSSGNMMAVASYGDKDYYKCKYCRYVAPFSSIVTQNYTKLYYSNDLHKCENDIIGLEYTFYEEHTILNNQCVGCGAHFHLYNDHYEQISLTQHKAFCECGAYILENHYFFDGECTLCGYEHTHDYSEWQYYSNTQHIEKCPCGEIGTVKRAHAVRSSDTGRYKRCISCGGIVDTIGGSNVIVSTGSLITENGSYILPGGIIVLVDEDIEAYFNDELVFYDPNDDLEAS